MLSDLLPLVSQRALTSAEVGSVLAGLLDPAEAADIKAALLRDWAQRGETAAELAACAEALLPRAADSGVRGAWRGRPLLDCCGTGGGGLNLLNVSTGLMFILAAIGIPVVKHGNRGVTKSSGSADVLEAMGIKVDLPAKELARCLEEVGCAFLFAPVYHTAFAAVAPVRRALAAQGQRTVFNLLGPLLNPTRPDARLVGVFKSEHVGLYAEALDLMNCPRFTVACGEDAATGTKLGEVSAQGTTELGSRFPLPQAAPTKLQRAFSASGEELDALLVRNPDESASHIETVLSGQDQGLAREMLIINAAMAAWTQGTAQSLDEGIALAAEALDSGAALAVLKRWQAFSEPA
jgi:anthranilate phosphoribosyltransferase